MTHTAPIILCEKQFADFERRLSEIIKSPKIKGDWGLPRQDVMESRKMVQSVCLGFQSKGLLGTFGDRFILTADLSWTKDDLDTLEIRFTPLIHFGHGVLATMVVIQNAITEKMRGALTDALKSEIAQRARRRFG